MARTGTKKISKRVTNKKVTRKRVTRKRSNKRKTHYGGSRVITKKNNFPKKDNSVYLIEDEPGLCVLGEKERSGRNVGEINIDNKLHYIYRVDKQNLQKKIKKCPGGLPTGIITIDDNGQVNRSPMDGNNEILRNIEDCNDNKGCKGKCSVSFMEQNISCVCDSKLKKCVKQKKSKRQVSFGESETKQSCNPGECPKGQVCEGNICKIGTSHVPDSSPPPIPPPRKNIQSQCSSDTDCTTEQTCSPYIGICGQKCNESDECNEPNRKCMDVSAIKGPTQNKACYPKATEEFLEEAARERNSGASLQSAWLHANNELKTNYHYDEEALLKKLNKLKKLKKIQELPNPMCDTENNDSCKGQCGPLGLQESCECNKEKQCEKVVNKCSKENEDKICPPNTNCNEEGKCVTIIPPPPPKPDCLISTDCTKKGLEGMTCVNYKCVKKIKQTTDSNLEGESNV